MSDQLAAGALDALGMSIIVSGWDDSELAASHEFASIRQSLYDQGMSCARIAAGLAVPLTPPDGALALQEDRPT